MNLFLPEENNLTIRSIQNRDLPAIESLLSKSHELHHSGSAIALAKEIENFRAFYSAIKLLSFFPNPAQHRFCIYVAEQEEKVVGAIKVAPANSSRSTWQVEHILVDPNYPVSGKRIGSQLLRYCFETIWEARTWILEVNIHHKNILSLYRRNGFQPLAQFTYWSIPCEKLKELGEREPKLPNLLPINNADAQLLYQLDTVSMPPLLRQVFDRHVKDFQRNIFDMVINRIQQWLGNGGQSQGYVFEPQRKAAIAYYQLTQSPDSSLPNAGKLTVHPAYTWLYPELLSKMAQLVSKRENKSLLLASADYQPEREEYLEEIGAERVEHTLLLSRSVWHKLREAPSSSLEKLQLSGVLQGLRPGRTPIPSRLPWLNSCGNDFYPENGNQDPLTPDTGEGEED
ncbi:GNAT family N-acetyltransferase [Euhalothece natronophila Z-M001]|uniref:GNAT family N-acetyltransferase n=1 Tax=Euhalothece natronophila Z-M001 TaxID=522448 RepID=A0A5B8NPP0_9CHRO|nr:GNAT family N-acetyltransferase [Euhalothece natronophila]QDZ40998.1 GNAT family N-acetyltransferase [Euhalothece natronophila Z-M001]